MVLIGASNMYAMAVETAGELKKLGVDATIVNPVSSVVWMKS